MVQVGTIEWSGDGRTDISVVLAGRLEVYRMRAKRETAACAHCRQRVTTCETSEMAKG